MGKKKSKKDLDDAFFADFAADGLENGTSEDAPNAAPIAPGTSAWWRAVMEIAMGACQCHAWKRS